MKGINLIKELPRKPIVTLNRSLGWIINEGLNKKHICIACFPKSGSTFLARTLEKVLNFKFLHYAHMGDSEHDIEEPILIDRLHRNTVTHLHMTATSNNLLAIARYKLKLVIQIRNIFDCIVSLRDHILEQSKIWPMAIVEEEFTTWKEEDQYDFLIANFLPWYIKFYVSWSKVDQNQPIYWIKYEDLMENQYETISKLLIFYNIKINNQKLEEVLHHNINLKKGEYRFNVGIPGRGVKRLNNDQINRIEGFARFYPSIDFEKIGLGL